jgi:hypothetical protein
MNIYRRFKQFILHNVGRRFSFFSRGLDLDMSSPFFEGLTDKEIKEIKRQVKETYYTDSVQKHLRFLDGVEKGVYEVGPLPVSLIKSAERDMKSAIKFMNSTQELANHSLVVRSSEGDFVIPKSFSLDLVATLCNT